MNFKINKISTLNQKMKTSKTPSLSWQNKLISTALASVSLILGTPQLAVATLPSTAATNLTIAGSATTSYGSGAGAGLTGVLAVNAGSSANTVLNWVNFSDGTPNGGLLTSADTITYSSTAAGGGAFLNNITGISPSVLGGTLTSTGKLFFLNPNGIIIGGSTAINASAFYASTVPDSAAITNFLQYGNLSVFSAGQTWANTLVPTATQVSGIVYVQSGATITVPVGTGVVGLASGYTGKGVSITGLSGGSFSTVNALTSGNTQTNSYTVTTGGNDGPIGVDGIGINGLSVNGNLQLITLGGNVTSNSALTVSSGVVNGSIAATGGNLTVTTSGGYIGGTSGATGSITAGGSVTLNTVGSNGVGGYVNVGSISAPGTTSGSSQTINAGASSVAGGAVTIGGGDLSNLTNVSGANVTITETPTGVGVTGRSFGTITSNGNVTLTETGSATLSVSTLTAITGNITVTSVGDLTISSLNSGSDVRLTTTQGSINLGNTTTTSYYNSTSVSPNQSVITSPNGIVVNKLTSSQPGPITISTTNSILNGLGAINLTNVTTNGVTTITTTNNNISLTTVTDAALYATNPTFTVTTQNGSIALSAVTTNGNTTFQTSGSATVASITATGAIRDLAPAGDATLTISTSTTSNANMALAGNAISLSGITTSNAAVVISANNGGISNTSASSIGGNLTITTKNGNISVSGATTMSQLTTTVANGTVSNNLVSLSTSSPNSTILFTGAGDIAISSLNNGSTYLTANLPNAGPYAALSTGNNSTSSTSVITTGNLSVSGNIVARTVDIEATAAGKNLTFLNGGVDTTINASSSIKLNAGGDLYTSGGPTFPTASTGVGLNQGPASITLISTSGNTYLNSAVTANLGTPGNVSANIGYTLTATTGNVTINQGTNVNLTANGLNLTAGNTILDTNNIYNLGTVGSTSNAGVTVSGLVVNLTGNNIIPLLSVNSPASSVTTVTTNNGGTMILSASNDLGALNLFTNGPVVIGASATDSVKVSGNLTITTTNSSAGSGSVSTVATGANLPSNIQINTNASNVSLGASSGSTATLGLVNASTGAGTLTVTTSSNVNLGTITSTGGTTVTSGGNITNSNGTLAGYTYTLSAGTASAPGSINLGGAGTNGVADGTIINLNNAGTITLNAAKAATVNTLGQNLTSATLNSGYLQTASTSSTAGNVTLNVTNGSVGSVTISTLSGISSLCTTNAPVTTAAISTNNGGVTIIATGNNNVPSFSSLALNYFGVNSSITGNGNLTVSNITSLSNPGAVTPTLTINAGASNATPTSAITGTGSLTLGSGIQLSGNQNLTLTTGNSNGSIGTITETAGSPVSVYAGTTTFIGKQIIMNLNPTSDSLSTVAFTSNGTVAYVENAAIKLGAVTLGTGATSGSWTSTTGNIQQTAVMNVTANTTPLTFVANGTNGGVLLNQTNTIAAGPSEIISITATGNSGITNAYPVVLGNVTVSNGGGTTTSNFNAASFVVNVNGAQNNIPTAIGQAANTSVWVWGNTTFNSAASAGSININNAGNNFGGLTVTSGTTTTANNVTIHETATSAYSLITANTFVSTSDLGSIALATTNTTITTGVGGGSTTLTAINGGVNLANPKTSATYTNGIVTINAGSSSSITDNSSSMLTIGSGTSVLGNLSISDPVSGATIADQSGSSSLNVTGILSLLAPSGNLQLTAANNVVGGLVTQAMYADNIFIQGNLNLVAGSYAPGVANYTATGNITSTGASTFGYLNLTSATGNVVLSTQTSVLNQLTVIARNGLVDLSSLSQSVDLHVGNGGVGLAPIVTSNTYKAPNN